MGQSARPLNIDPRFFYMQIENGRQCRPFIGKHQCIQLLLLEDPAAAAMPTAAPAPATTTPISASCVSRLAFALSMRACALVNFGAACTTGEGAAFVSAASAVAAQVNAPMAKTLHAILIISDPQTMATDLNDFALDARELSRHSFSRKICVSLEMYSAIYNKIFIRKICLVIEISFA
jgi:hypothetical protein